MAGLGWGGRGCPQGPLPLPHALSHCSPSKGHQGHTGVRGPGEHKEKNDQQLHLGHLPLSLQPLSLPGGLTPALKGPESLQSPRKSG